MIKRAFIFLHSLLLVFFTSLISQQALADDTNSHFSLNSQANVQNILYDENPHFTLESKWYLSENNEFILAIDLNFEDGFYTYDPLYKSFPTSFKLYGEDYLFFYPKVDKSYDALTKKELKLYSNNTKYFILFKNSSSFTTNNDFEIQVSFLVCSSSNCTPFNQVFKLEIPNKSLLDPLPQTADIENHNNYSQLEFDFINSNLKREEKNSSHSSHIVKKSETIIPESQNQEDYTFDFNVQIASSVIEATSLSLALILGLTAGFILNFMPCVLPVVAIKMNSIILTAHFEPLERNKLISKHCIFFSLGILTLFTFLAILFGLFGMMWGSIFQNTYFILFLISIIFLFALSFLHLFSLPMFNISTPKAKSHNLDSYFQGFVTTLIATPCSGPLLGSTLGFSLTLPLPLLILVFLFTGVGMALPYLILAVIPQAVRFIPRSGAWTDIMEKILAFILLLTVLYLISILPSDMIIQSLAYLLSSAFFLYIYSLFRRAKHSKLWAFILLILHIVLSAYIFAPESEEKLNWQEYSYNEFKDELGKNYMIVDFTADWCPTCQVLKETVLTHKNLQALVDEYNIKLIRVDMTSFSKENKDFLASLDSASIPVLAIFRKDIFAYSPILLRDIYTFNQLKEVIESNF